MLTGEVKTFTEIFYLIRRYGPLRVMREFPGKRRKTFGLDNHKTKLLKKVDVQAHAWSRISRTVRKANERRDR